MIEFEWDSAKAAANFRKHGVSFEEEEAVEFEQFEVQLLRRQPAEVGAGLSSRPAAAVRASSQVSASAASVMPAVLAAQ